MKTISPNRSIRPYSRRGRRYSFMLLLLVCVALVVGLLAWRDAVSSLLLRALAPAVHLRDSLTANEDTQLRAELASTTAALLDRDHLYAENLDLKQRLGRDAHMQTILAGVLLRPPGIPYDTLVIDAGTQQGVAEGDLVSAGGTTLIGTVATVYDTTARVELFSAPGKTFDALLLTSNATTVTPADANASSTTLVQHMGDHTIPVSVQGQGGGSFVAQVPAGAHVSVGDSVLFPGVAGGYAGAVSAVFAKNGESFETLYLHLPVAITDLRFVEVWVSPVVKNE